MTNSISKITFRIFKYMLLAALCFGSLPLFSAPHVSAAPLEQDSPANWTMEGLDEKDKFATAAAGLDVNGDGYTDLAVSAVGVEEGKRGGQVWIYHGSEAGLATEPAWHFKASSDSDNFGSALFSAGDANGDGFDDLLIGARGDGSGGKVSLYMGSADGLSTEPAWFVEGPDIGDRIGEKLATGDLNGDGYVDYIMGAPDANFPNGMVQIYWGAENGTISGRSLTLTAGKDNKDYGTALAVGDANGDGYDDLVIAGGSSIHEQYALLYLGEEDGLSDPVWGKFPDDEDLDFGFSMSFGDTNGDGKADLLVGMPGFDEHRGAAILFRGSENGLEEEAAWSTSGTGSYDYVGKAVAMLPVVDSENQLTYEMVVSTDQVGYDTTGGMRRFNDSGDGSVASAVSQRLNQLDSFGEVGGLISIGDVNGDGAYDLAMLDTQFDSFRGRVSVYHGTDVLPQETIAKIKAGNAPKAKSVRSNRQVGYPLPAAYQSMSRDEKIRELLVANGTQEQFAQTIDPTFEAIASLTPELPGEFMEEAKARMTIDSLMEPLVEVYANHYTDTEIDVMLGFYASEIGQSIAAKQAQVTTAAMEAGQAWGQEIAADVLADLEANAASE